MNLCKVLHGLALFVLLTSIALNGSTIANSSGSNLISHLPILSIETNGQDIVDDPRIIAQMKVFSNDSGLLNSIADVPSDYDGNISIELRGASSQLFEKKSYSFETQLIGGENNNVSLLGLPSENDWILYGPYSDKSLMRNALAYQLAREMGWYASRKVYCELLINGDYRGIYILGEKIKRDKNRVDIDRLDMNDNLGDSVTGGYIFKVDWPDDGVNYDWNSTINSYNGNWLDLKYQYEYPDRNDITLQQEVHIQQNVFNFEHALIGSDFQDLELGYRKHIDMHSFVDHFILNEITYNVDAHRLSNFYTKVRDSKGGKIFAGPVWDFNLGFGNVDFGVGWTSNGWALDNPYVIPYIPFHLKRLKEDPAFEQLLKCRWNELRNNVLSVEHINGVVDSIVTYLGPAIERNYEQWEILGTYVWPNYFVGDTYEEEIIYLKNFIANRLLWIDNNLPGNENDCESESLDEVILTEINYQSNPGFEAGDWFELHNKGVSSVDLSGWVVKDENNLNTYTIESGTILEPDNYLVLCSDLSDFDLAFPSVSNRIGSFNWKLGSSDQIRIYDPNGFLVTQIDYTNEAPWPELIDGSTETLELSNINVSQNNPLNWFIGCPGGTPGIEYSFPCPIVSIAENESSEFFLYPNPVKDQLFIKGNFDRNVGFEILGIDGQTIDSGLLAGGNKFIDTSSLIPGYYRVKIGDKRMQWTAPFIKVDE